MKIRDQVVARLRELADSLDSKKRPPSLFRCPSCGSISLTDGVDDSEIADLIRRCLLTTKAPSPSTELPDEPS